tara:strand:- start:701 stop:1654 length:954 start_codon:yes stop_codon:yes gene_type:complete
MNCEFSIDGQVDEPGKELWNYQSSKNGDGSGLSIKEIIRLTNEEDYQIISCSTDGMASRFKTWASALRIDKNCKVFWWPKQLTSAKFVDLFKDDDLISTLPPKDINFILYGEPLLLPLPTDNIDDNFTDEKLFRNKTKLGYNVESKRRLDWEYFRIPNEIREEYVNVFSLIKSKIKDDILEEVENFSKKFNDKTISVHVRSGTGIPIEGIADIEKRSFKSENFIKIMESYSDDYTFFVSSDEYFEQDWNQFFLDRLKDKFGDRVFHQMGNSTSLRTALIDLLLLSKNKIIIGTHLSSFTEVAWFFSGGKSEIILPGW